MTARKHPWARISVRVLFLMIGLSAASSAWEDDYFPRPDADGGWRTLTHAGRIRKIAGMDLHKLDWAFEYASRTSQHGGLLVARHGYVVYEKYYGKGNREALPAMASVGKAYTSIACGINAQGKARADSRRPGDQSIHREVPARSVSAERSAEDRDQAGASADHGIGH